MAARHELRGRLHALLRHFGSLDLFPEEQLSAEAQASAELCYWMMHPNELQDPPEAIELVEIVNRVFDVSSASFYVFRYRMPEGHWAADDGWLLGVAGPYFGTEEPYCGVGAFSRFGDKHGETDPATLVDWYANMAWRRGVIDQAPSGTR